MPDSVIYVSGLPATVGVVELKELFECFGNIISVKKFPPKQRNLGYGFIAFSSPTSAYLAIDAMHGQHLGDVSLLKVRLAQRAVKSEAEGNQHYDESAATPVETWSRSSTTPPTTSSSGCVAVIPRPIGSSAMETWYYLTPKDGVKGPFPQSDMRAWFVYNYLEPKLPVRLAWYIDFYSLEELFSRNLQRAFLDSPKHPATELDSKQGAPSKSAVADRKPLLPGGPSSLPLPKFLQAELPAAFDSLDSGHQRKTCSEGISTVAAMASEGGNQVKGLEAASPSSKGPTPRDVSGSRSSTHPWQ
mmetsp:Transcript_29872/g.65162  ORF Transcript_29872/g.65162 Transcript_29872/m.65162 type:complete len:302 (-) Transcript_29872:123-1028(-)